MSVEHRLCVYGSLAPGHKNHNVLEGIRGCWRRGRVEGEMHDHGWGAEMGFPAMTPSPRSGCWIDVWILESTELPDHWNRLDEFEGKEYSRKPVEIHTDSGTVLAYLYAMR